MHGAEDIPKILRAEWKFEFNDKVFKRWIGLWMKLMFERVVCEEKSLQLLKVEMAFSHTQECAQNRMQQGIQISLRQ